MSVTIAICTYRREQVLVQTIREVYRQSPPADEILIVDQTPEHDADVQAFLDAEHVSGRLRLVRQSPPNLPAARNRALTEARGDVVLFLDDDVLLAGDDLVAFHRARFDDPSVHAVAGADLSAWGAFAAIADAEALRLGPNVPANAAVHLRGIAMLRGAHHSVRRQAAIAAGGYDESLVGSAFGEDFDIACRIGGAHILTTGRVAVLHLRAPAGGCRVTDGRASMPEWTRSVSALIIVLRHGRKFPRTRLPWLKTALRAGPLRRENVVNPLRWPRAWFGFARAVVEAIRRARVAVRSPFVAHRPPV